MERANDALDEAAKAVATDGDGGGGPSTGTAGFGKAADPHGASSSKSAVSGTTRKRVAQRAAVKLRAAKDELGEVSKRFADLRRHSAALADALARSEHAFGGVTRQLQTTVGYAEEQAMRLQRIEQERQGRLALVSPFSGA